MNNAVSPSTHSRTGTANQNRPVAMQEPKREQPQPGGYRPSRMEDDGYRPRMEDDGYRPRMEDDDDRPLNVKGNKPYMEPEDEEEPERREVEVEKLNK